MAQAALLGEAIPSAGETAGVLVLTRKTNQSIMIGDDIEISVLAIMGEKVTNRNRGATLRAGLPT